MQTLQGIWINTLLCTRTMLMFCLFFSPGILRWHLLAMPVQTKMVARCMPRKHDACSSTVNVLFALL